MKKITLFLFMMLAAMAAKAQIYAGGSLGFWYDNGDDGGVETTTFTISPEIGYNLNSKWAIGMALGFSHITASDEAKVKTTGFAIAPYARFSFYENKMVRLFIDGGFGFSTVNSDVAKTVNGIEAGFKPGIALKLNEHFSLIGKVGFLGYRDDYISGADGQGLALSSEDLSLGFHYEF